MTLYYELLDYSYSLSVSTSIVMVNDTLTGDPLMTVPILTDPNVMPGDAMRFTERLTNSSIS